MTRIDPDRRRPASLMMPILRVSRRQKRDGVLTIGGLLEGLGDRSFGWGLMVFSLLTLLPLPPGSSLITGLPMLLVTLQMVLGYRHVTLPGRIARKPLDRDKLRRALFRLRPVTRRLDRILKPRLPRVFSAEYERLIGLVLFVVAFALFLPIPLSGWFPAVSLFICGVGMVERDGAVTITGIGLGAASAALTAAIAVSLYASADVIMN